MKLVFSSRARSDLLAIAEYIARDNPVRAESFVGQLEKRCLDLIKVPHSGAAVMERAGVRRIVHGRYLIFYRVDQDWLRILAVLGGEMDLDALQFEP